MLVADVNSVSELELETFDTNLDNQKFIIKIRYSCL